MEVMMYSDSIPEVVSPTEGDTYKISKYSGPTTPSPEREVRQYNLPVAPTAPTTTEARRTYGLPWLCAAVVVGAVLASAAIGGGLGSQYASCLDHLKTAKDSSSNSNNNNNNNNTDCTAKLDNCLASASLSTTDYVPLSPPNIESLHSSCENGTSLYSGICTIGVCTRAPRSETLCGYDMSWKDQAPGERTGREPTNIIAVVAYTLDACVEACDHFNEQQIFWGRVASVEAAAAGNGSWCTSIGWWPSMADSYDVRYSNCWLRDDTYLANGDTMWDRDDPTAVTAVLVDFAEYAT